MYVPPINRPMNDDEVDTLNSLIDDMIGCAILGVDGILPDDAFDGGENVPKRVWKTQWRRFEDNSIGFRIMVNYRYFGLIIGYENDKAQSLINVIKMFSRGCGTTLKLFLRSVDDDWNRYSPPREQRESRG